jgi:hypothetical protein
MIRDMKYADIAAVTRFLEACHARTHYAKTGTAGVDIPETKRLLGAGLGRHGHKGIGACWVQVATDDDGFITGLMYATLARVYSISDRLYATDLFWIVNDHAKAGDGLALMQNMLEWARAAPLVIEVHVGATAIINDRPDVTSRMLKKLGMTNYGNIHRLEFGEAKCLASSAA